MRDDDRVAELEAENSRLRIERDRYRKNVGIALRVAHRLRDECNENERFMDILRRRSWQLEDARDAATAAADAAAPAVGAMAEKLSAVMKERDRLRVGVEALRTAHEALCAVGPEEALDRLHDREEAMFALLGLYGSEVMGGESVGARIKREGEHGRQVLLDRMVADSSCTAEYHNCGLVVDVTTGTPTRAICRECGRRWNVESAHHEGTDGKPDA
jgi:hypothetical protein